MDPYGIIVETEFRSASKLKAGSRSISESLWRLKMELWRALDAHNGGSKWSPGKPVNQWHHC
jgi:hypothetical protein